MEVRKGTYVLFLRFDSAKDIEVGALGMQHIPRGYYCYVGSALAGLDQRLSRHLSKDKKLKWHIDHLTSVCDRSFAYESSGDYIEECDLAGLVEDNGAEPFIKGFGCSDCDCFSHLFRVKPRALIAVLINIGMVRFVIGNRDNSMNVNQKQF